MSPAAAVPPPAEVRSILVLRPRALGDVLQSTPALRALRQGYPQASLHVLIDETLAPLLLHNRDVDRLWLLPRRGRARGRRWVRLYWELARAGFDLAIDLHGSPGTALLARLTRAPWRAGYEVRGRSRLYTHRVPRDTDRWGRQRSLYAAAIHLELVARCGVRGPALDDTSLVFSGDPEVEARMDLWLEQHAPARPRIGIAAPGTCPARTWPLESYARLADLLVENGARVLLLWGPGERPTAERLQAHMRQPSTLAPPTDLLALGAVLARLDLLVGNDSGPKHLAVARGTPTLTLFGPTNPANWSPPGREHAVLRAALPCLGCNFRRCDHHLCMRLLEPETVARRALEMLAARDHGARHGCAS